VTYDYRLGAVRGEQVSRSDGRNVYFVSFMFTADGDEHLIGMIQRDALRHEDGVIARQHGS
jgi:hypothetical protein